MDTKDQQIKLLAQAVYELRLLLSGNLGSPAPDSSAEKIAAHLSYALHNEALAVLENKEEKFVVEKSLKTLQHLDKLFGDQKNSPFKKIINATKT